MERLLLAPAMVTELRTLMLEMSNILPAIAWVLVAGLFAVAAVYLYLAWLLWREEKREQPEEEWRLRRSGPEPLDSYFRAEPRAGARADQRPADKPEVRYGREPNIGDPPSRDGGRGASTAPSPHAPFGPSKALPPW
jgi:hypothetical protein